MRSFFHASCVALALAGCTLNVQTFDREITSETTEPFARLRMPFETSGAAVEGEIVVRGVERVGGSATMSLTGLLGASDDPDAIARGVDISWQVEGDDVAELRVGYDGPLSENVWIDGMHVELAVGTGLDATIGAASIDVAGLDAESIVIDAGSGSIRVRDAAEVLLSAGSGSIDVEAEHGSLETGSGSIRAAFTGPLGARAGSGSIEGSFGGHAEAETGSGSIELELLTELDGDVRLSAGSGSVTLVVPPGAGMRLALNAGSGSVTVRAGDVSFRGESWSGEIGDGAHTVRIETGSGSITVRERAAD